VTNDAEISKFLSYVLRHDPASIGLMLDPQGWVDVNDLLARATKSGRGLDRTTLHRVVAENDKKRFTLSEDGDRIRAAQGHSVKVELGLSPVDPPTVLYHGTADRFIDSILREGLRPQSRQQVHLSLDVATATAVGTRHGRPIVLLIDAAAMHRNGRLFYRADNGVWLTDEVPPNYISRTT
jgi:putative RNA 2'-phosphotransferase